MKKDVTINFIINNTRSDMEHKYNEMSYSQLLDKLDCCEKDSDLEFEVYQKLVELAEKEIEKFEEDLSQAPIDRHNSELILEEPLFLDDYIAPMDNLARIYIEHKEYAKALPLLHRVLPVYRTLEIYNPNYTYQRCYALKAMVECLKQLGEKTLSVLYGYELKHLKHDVLELREKL